MFNGLSDQVPLSFILCRIQGILQGCWLRYLLLWWDFCCRIWFQEVFLFFWSKLVTIVEGDQKAPFLIATTLRCRGGRYSFPWTFFWSTPFFFFLSSLFAWWCMPLIFPAIYSFLFLKVFLGFLDWVISFLLRFVFTIFHH